MSEIGLIIGRFQPLHKGHLLLIKESLRCNKTTLILIGSTNKSDDFNPYSYTQRKDLIQGEFPCNSLVIGELPDFPEDNEWVGCILSQIAKGTTYCRLYCGDMQNDSAVKSLQEFKHSLPFTLEIIEIPRSILRISATEIRRYLEENNTQKLKEYLG